MSYTQHALSDKYLANFPAVAKAWSTLRSSAAMVSNPSDLGIVGPGGGIEGGRLGTHTAAEELGRAFANGLTREAVALAVMASLASVVGLLLVVACRKMRSKKS